jgi:hypothetical protein
MVTRKTKTKRTSKGSVRTTTTKDGPKIVTVTRTTTPKGTLTQTHIKVCAFRRTEVGDVNLWLGRGL